MSPKRKHSNAEADSSTLPSKRRRTPSFSRDASKDSEDLANETSLSQDDTDMEDDPILADEDEALNKKGVADYTEEEWDALEKSFIPQIDKRREMKEYHYGAAAESGIILRVELVQFMCHKNFTFDFGDQMNFIIGMNGSGKSAILTGITVGLGGKASVTGRGTGMKTLIREGQSKAQVSVILKNRGSSAYKPEAYGKKITVVRTFTRKGASSYKILSDKGVTVSTRKADLDAICEHMGIQVDNPVSILTQDVARTFVRNANPSYKYDLFLRGTYLRDLSEEYESIRSNTFLIDKALEEKVGQRAELEEHHERARREYQEGLKAQDLRSKKSRLLIEKAWAHVAAKQTELTKSYESVALSERRLEKIGNEYKSADVRFGEATSRIKELEMEHNAAKVEANSLHGKRQGVKNNILEKKKEISDLKADEKAIDSSMNEADSDIVLLQASITRESQTLEEDVKAKQEELRSRMDAIRKIRDDLKMQLESRKSENDHFAQDLTQAESQLTVAKKGVDDARRSKESLEGKISSIKAHSHDPLSAFGRNLGEVDTAIKAARWYGQEPVGPLGKYVELDDIAKWGNLMRAYIGGHMQAFAVTDSRDLQPLKAILKRTGNNNNPILVAGIDMFDFSHGEPPEDFLTPLRVLRISDEWVKRLLVNSSSIERLYLAKDFKEADSLLLAQGGGVALTANLLTVTRWRGAGGKCVVMPNLKNSDPRASLFQPGNAQIRLRQLENELKPFQIKLDEALSRIRTLEGEASSWRQLINQCKSAGRSIEAQIRTQERSLQELEAEGREDAPVSIAAIQQMIDDKETEKANLRLQFTDIQERKLTLQNELTTLQTLLVSMKADDDGSNSKLEALATKIEKEVIERRKATNNRDHYRGKRETEMTVLARLKTTADVVERTFGEWREKAEEVGEKVEVTRPIDELARELESLNVLLTAQELRNPKSAAQLLADVQNALAAYEKNKAERRGLHELSKALHASLESRIDTWSKWLAYCSISCKRNFAYNLSTRGYFGQVLIDHAKGTLDIKVQKDDQAHQPSQNHRNDPAALSGGEKSFSTLCLFLSLWETCSLPLRCLDEFDVYMDPQIRNTSIKMLISTAKISQGKQFILITPNSIDNVYAEPPVVRISRMADPRA